MIDRPIREAIDACRPGAGDLHLPEMEELAERIRRDARVRECYERAQRLDSRIREAFCDVPAPAGLAARLLAAVAQEPADAALDDSDSPGPEQVEERLVRRRREAPRLSRRTLWVGSLTAAAVLLAVAVSFFFLRPRTTIDPGAMAEAADGWVRKIMQGESSWRADLAAAPRKEYPLPAVLKGTPAAWARLRLELTNGLQSILLDRRAVVYDLRGDPGQRQAMLFVVRSAADVQAPWGPPRRPTRMTGGWSIGVWREGRRLYVLAVEGDERRYRSFIEPPPRLA